MEELERKVEEPGFWDRPEESQKLMKELKYLQELVKQIRELYRSYEDIGTLIEMGYEENDPEIAAEAERDLQKFAEVFEELKIQTLLSGEYDSCNAIVTIHAGAGGTESCDWASMLYRMYSRWAERKGFQIQVLDPSRLPPSPGTYWDPPCYESSQEDVEAFDRQFPEKKKEVRPGQLRG